MAADSMQGLSTFVRVVESGSFTSAARRTGTTPSAISKTIARLEARTGARLIQRSTRALALTPEGRAYFQRIAPLVRALEEASEALHTPRGVLQGILRVSMPTDLGRAIFDEVATDFLPKHPDLSWEASFSDRHVDIIRSGFDVAIRAGKLADTELTARAIGKLPLILVASPQYLQRSGEPLSLDDLKRHQHVTYLLNGEPYPLQLASGDTVPVTGTVSADDGGALRIAALRGLGIAQLLASSVAADLALGRLRRVAPQVQLAEVPIYAVHAYGRLTPARVAGFVDFVSALLKHWAVEPANGGTVG